MRSVYDFIIRPVGERYSNELKVSDKKQNTYDDGSRACS